MISKSAVVYDRGSDGLFVHPHAFTTMGVLLEVPPYRRICQEDRDRLLWPEVAAALALSCRTVPHPKDPNRPSRLAQFAGFKSWRAFAREAATCDVHVIGGTYVFSPGFWDGRGYDGVEQCDRRLPLTASEEELLRCLNECLERSREGPP